MNRGYVKKCLAVILTTMLLVGNMTTAFANENISEEDIVTGENNISENSESDEIEKGNTGVEEPGAEIKDYKMQSEFEKGIKENSWRYQDGQPIDSSSGDRSLNYKAYHENATRQGIDVSQWQGVIDWEQVKASGIDFAIIRCGYGKNYSEQDDLYWQRNVSECERLGIPYGV